MGSLLPEKFLYPGQGTSSWQSGIQPLQSGALLFIRMYFAIALQAWLKSPGTLMDHAKYSG
jgi:hypothetical protein